MVKKIFLTFCLLVLCVTVSSGGIVDKLKSVIARKNVAGANHCTDTACAACDEQERFECGSTDGNEEQSWTQVGGNGTFDMDYTTTILAGTESLYLERNTASEYWYFTNTGSDNKIYVAHIVQFPQGSAGNDTGVLALANGATILMRMRWWWNDDDPDYWRVQIYYDSQGSNAFQGAFTVLEDTKYYVKIAYDNGSGADAEIDVWLSANGTDWTSVLDVNDGTDTAQVNRVYMYNTGDNGTNWIADDIRVRVDGTDVGNY